MFRVAHRYLLALALLFSSPFSILNCKLNRSILGLGFFFFLLYYKPQHLLSSCLLCSVHTHKRHPLIVVFSAFFVLFSNCLTPTDYHLSVLIVLVMLFWHLKWNWLPLIFISHITFLFVCLFISHTHPWYAKSQKGFWR